MLIGKQNEAIGKRQQGEKISYLKGGTNIHIGKSQVLVCVSCDCKEFFNCLMRVSSIEKEEKSLLSFSCQNAAAFTKEGEVVVVTIFTKLFIKGTAIE